MIILLKEKVSNRSWFLMKEVSMTLRAEADLRKWFTAVVEREHRPAAQVLRDFVCAYVNPNNRCSSPRTSSNVHKGLKD
jgi:hypothetical protein